MTTPHKPLLSALLGQRTESPPLWLMRQAGRYLPEYRNLRKKSQSFLDFCHSPDLATEVSLQPIRRFDFDGAILFSDILVIPDALGCPVDFIKDVGPVLNPIAGPDSLERLSLSSLEKGVSPSIETIKRLKTALPKEKTLIGFAGAPWTVAAYMTEGRGSRNFQIARSFARKNQKDFQSLIDLLVEATGIYLSRQIEAGADAIQLFDSWAGLLPEDEFERWVISPTKKLVASIRKKHPKTPIIGFPRGAGLNILRYAQETEINALSLDETIPLNWAVEMLSGKVALQGNLDPVLLLTGGDALDRGINLILEAFQETPFIFNLGHGIFPETPIEHVHHLIKKVRSGK